MLLYSLIMSCDYLRELPNHTYVLRGHTPPEGHMSLIEKKMIEAPIHNLPPEIELPTSFEMALTEIQAGLDDFAKQTFGVDASSRLPQREQIHIFDADNFSLLKNQIQLDQKAEGFTVRHNIYFPFTGQDEATFTHDMMHEHVHAISGNVHMLTFRGSADRPVFRHKHLRDGYMVRGIKERHGGTPLRAMEEYIAEKTTKQALQHVGKSDALSVPGFSQLMPIGDQVLDIVANTTGVPEEEILHELMLGQLESDMKALRTVLQALGPAAKEFTHVDSRGESLANFSQKLGGTAVRHVHKK